MTAVEVLTDAAVGETRQVLLQNGRAFALSVWRWSDRGRRAQWGEVYDARVRSVDVRRRGAFLDLGIAEPGFVRLDAAGRVRIGDAPHPVAEGQAVRTHVKRESARTKSPVLSVAALLPTIDKPGCVLRHEAEADAERAGPADGETRERIDAIVDAALAPTAPIPGGGLLTIEPTAALVAIDVDAGERAGTGDAELFATRLNADAAREAARQLRLRSLGGIVAIDFVSMRDRRDRESVWDCLRTDVASDPWGVQIAPMSRFGVVELSRGQLRRPLHELMCDAGGSRSAETEALAMLRGVEREVRAARGRLATALAGAEVKAWLDAAPFDWRAGLTARIGPRWDVRADAHVARRGWRVEVA